MILNVSSLLNIKGDKMYCVSTICLINTKMHNKSEDVFEVCLVEN